MVTQKITQLRFRAVNKDFYEAILTGRKRVETRANSPKFQNLKVGDEVLLICGRNKSERKIRKVKTYKSIEEILQAYRPDDIVPGCITKEDLEKVYYSFPNYEEKIKKFGLIAMEFEK